MDEKKELCNKSSENRIKNPSESSEQTEVSNPSVLKPTPEMKERLKKRIEEYERQRELQEQLYAQLSEEDREALNLGKEIQRQRKQAETQRKREASKKRKNRYGKFGSWKKNIVSIAAGIGIVIAVTSGLTIASVGGPKQALKIVREILGERNRITVNGVIEGEEKESGMDGMDAEERAYQQIKDELGFDPVRLGYLPEGMVFDSIFIDKETQNIDLYYKNETGIITYVIQKNYNLGKMAIDVEDKILKEYEEIVEGTQIKVSEYEIKDSKEKVYTVEFEFNNTWYALLGVKNLDEIEKIIKNLYF